MIIAAAWLMILGGVALAASASDAFSLVGVTMWLVGLTIQAVGVVRWLRHRLLGLS